MNSKSWFGELREQIASDGKSTLALKSKGRVNQNLKQSVPVAPQVL